MRTMSACCLTISLKSLDSVMDGGTAVRRNCEAESRWFEYTGMRLLWRSCGRCVYLVDHGGKTGPAELECPYSQRSREGIGVLRLRMCFAKRSTYFAQDDTGA